MGKKIGIEIKPNYSKMFERNRLDVAISNLPIYVKKNLWKSIHLLEGQYSELEKRKQENDRKSLNLRKKIEEQEKKIEEFPKYFDLIKSYSRN